MFLPIPLAPLNETMLTEVFSKVLTKMFFALCCVNKFGEYSKLPVFLAGLIGTVTSGFGSVILKCLLAASERIFLGC